MSASILESQAAFVERAKAINMPDALIDLMIEKGLTSFGKLAFISPVEPRSGDDSSMAQAVGAILGRDLRPAEIPDMRRLWFESHTLAVSDMKTRIERSSLDPPREMPLAERMNRLEDQKKRLPSIVFSEHVEPAHCLIDKVQNMLESGYLTYLPSHKCPSRATEIAADKATPQLTFDAQGAIKVSKKQSDLECNSFGELKLKEAFQRRSLAFDQIHLMSFIVQEKWHAHLFQSITRDPPPGHRYVSIAQALNADRESGSSSPRISESHVHSRPAIGRPGRAVYACASSGYLLESPAWAAQIQKETEELRPMLMLSRPNHQIPGEAVKVAKARKEERVSRRTSRRKRKPSLTNEEPRF